MHSILAKDAQVTESAFVNDIQTSAKVEIDVLINAKVGGTDISVGIECRDRKRPATVEWVREIKGKHEHLPIDKTVLVSSSGFSSEAKRKAAALGIDTLSIDQAENKEWKEYIESLSDLKFAGFSVSLVQTTIKFENPSVIDPSKFSDETELVEDKSGYRGTVNEYAALLMRADGAIKATAEKWLQQKDRPKVFQPTINYTPGYETRVTDSDGRKHVVKSIHCKVNISVKEASLKMETSKFRGVNFATGEVEDVFSGDPKRKLLVVNKEEDGELGPGVILTPEGEIRKAKKK